jgi:hypothetical protein
MRITFFIALLAGFSCSEPKSVPVEEKTELTFSTQEFVKNTCIGESCASVSFTWPLAKGSEIASKINEAIDQQLLVYFGRDSIAPTLEDNAQLYLNSYEDFVNQFPDSPGGWSIEVSAKVSYESDSLLSIFFTEFNFSGGAHPNSSQFFMNFDKITGEYLSSGRVVLDSAKLLEIAEIAFRKHHEVPEGKSLEDQGFFLPETGFFLPGAMGYKEDKFKLIYIPYEIGPYVMGYTELTFTPEELTGIVRK